MLWAYPNHQNTRIDHVATFHLPNFCILCKNWIFVTITCPVKTSKGISKTFAGNGFIRSTGNWTKNCVYIYKRFSNLIIPQLFLNPGKFHGFVFWDECPPPKKRHHLKTHGFFTNSNSLRLQDLGWQCHRWLHRQQRSNLTKPNNGGWNGGTAHWTQGGTGISCRFLGYIYFWDQPVPK